MKKIWLTIIGMLASLNNAHANIYEVAMSFDDEAINVNASEYDEDQIIRLEQMLSEYEYLSPEEKMETKKQIDELVKILIDKGILMSATLVCAICQGGKEK